MGQILTVAQVLEYTDRLGGLYEVAGTPLTAIAAKLQSGADFVFGGASNANVSLGDPYAQQRIGDQFLASLTSASGPGFYASLLGNIVAGMSSYLMQRGPQGAATGVIDIPSFLRHANGCPNWTTAGNGAGSDYSHLTHPSYAALIALLVPASPLPPDVVFAPTGTVLGTFNAATNAFTAGTALMTPGSAPYAPTNSFTAATPAAGPALPNGSCYVTVTGLSQAGASVTWRGNIGTGLTAAGQMLATGILQGTSGGANGGTAAPTDRLKSITGIARDTSISSGGTATQGVINIITVGLRASL